jgi:hypothetical protein
VPTLDGTLEPGWPAPSFSFALSGVPGDTVDVILAKNATTLYVALSLNKVGAITLNEWIRVYFDTNGSGGVPGTEDRYYDIGADFFNEDYAGDGVSAWNVGYSGGGWNWGHLGTGSPWVVELSFDLASELAAPGAAFGMLTQANFDGAGVATWPTSGSPTALNTWLSVNNSAVCP